MRLWRIFKEIRNYLYLKSIIRKHSKSAEWIKHDLNVGWFGVIYTVVNLPPEVAESEPAYYHIYVLDQLVVVNEYFTNLNIQEIVRPQIDELVNRETGSFAYGVKFIPLFNDLTWQFALSSVATLTGIAYIAYLFMR